MNQYFKIFFVKFINLLLSPGPTATATRLAERAPVRRSTYEKGGKTLKSFANFIGKLLTSFAMAVGEPLANFAKSV